METKRDDETYKVCPSCGELIKWDAVICTYCGVQVQELKVDTNYNHPKYIENSYPVKSKVIAVVLAIFFGYWSWLYTYRINSRKLWFLLIIDILRFFFLCYFIISKSNLDFYNYSQIFSSDFYILILLNSTWTLITWLWALINNSIKPNSFYRDYPKI